MNINAIKPIVSNADIVLESSILPKVEKAAKSSLPEFFPESYPIDLEKIKRNIQIGEDLNIFG